MAGERRGCRVRVAADWAGGVRGAGGGEVTRYGGKGAERGEEKMSITGEISQFTNCPTEI